VPLGARISTSGGGVEDVRGDECAVPIIVRDFEARRRGSEAKGKISVRGAKTSARKTPPHDKLCQLHYRRRKRGRVRASRDRVRG
jgi:hypothetical protein